MHAFLIGPIFNFQDWDLFRVWDSMEIEDEEATVKEFGVRTDGHMDDSENAKGLLWLGFYFWAIMHCIQNLNDRA